MSRALLAAMLALALPRTTVLAQGEGPEPEVTHVYACQALDCRVLATRLGGTWVADPLGDLVAFGPRRMAQGRFLVAGIAPFFGDVFSQSGGFGGSMGVGGGGGRASLGPYLPPGLLPPVGILEQNAIILRGTPEAVDAALELLRLIDRPAPMVMIEVQAISTPEVFDRGRSLHWRAIGGDGSTVDVGLGAPGGGLTLAWATGDIAMALNEFETYSQGYSEEAVSIMTESGMPAYIGTRYTEPAFLPERVYDRSGVPMTVYNVVFTEYESSLYVVPRVNGNNTVTMYLSPRFSRKVGEVAPPGGTPFPIVETTGLDTLVTVRDGQTIAIGGLQRITVDRSLQGIGPVPASRLPELRRTTRVENVTMFVTPRIYRLEDDPFKDIEM